MSKKCSIEGCENKHYGKGYCEKHYKQVYRKGSLDKTRQRYNEIVQYETYAELILYDKDYQESDRAKISLEDIDKVRYIKWYKDKHGYAINRTYGSLHRYIMDCPDDKVIDHINRDRLDNRRINLRICTAQENQMNKSKQKNNNSSFPGVSKTYNGKWRARIMLNKKENHLGVFNSFEEAVEARKQAEIDYFGEFAPHLINKEDN